MKVANSIGRFIYFDDMSLGFYDKRIFWVLVERDVSQGLPAELKVSLGDTNFNKRLYFWKTSFRCTKCRQSRHLQVSCDFEGVPRFSNPSLGVKYYVFSRRDASPSSCV